VKSFILYISSLFFFINYNLNPIFSFYGIPSLLSDLILIFAILCLSIVFFMTNKLEKYPSILLLSLSVLIIFNLSSFSIIQVLTPLLFVYTAFILASNVSMEFSSQTTFTKNNLQFTTLIFLIVASYATYCFSLQIIESLKTGVWSEINRQGMATFFLVLPFLYKLFEYTYKFKPSNFFYLFLLIVCLTNVLVLQSRTASIACIMYFLIFFLMSKNKAALVFIGFLTISPIVFLFWENLLEFAPRLFNYSYIGSDTSSNSIAGRYVLYNESLSKITTNPILGDFPPMNNFLLEHYPHNFILEIFIDFGMIIGSASIIAIIYLIIINFRISVWMLPLFAAMSVSWSIYNSKIFFLILFLLLFNIKNTKPLKIETY